MCPLRLILVFLSATLAGYFAWRSIRSPPVSDGAVEVEPPADDHRKGRGLHVLKVMGDKFWVFVDMASGRYLWRAMKERRLCNGRGGLDYGLKFSPSVHYDVQGLCLWISSA